MHCLLRRQCHVLTTSLVRSTRQTSMIKITTAAQMSRLISQYNPIPTFSTSATRAPIHHIQSKSPFSSTAHTPTTMDRYQVISIPLSTNLNSIPTALHPQAPSISPLPLLVVLDFDGTITQQDSLDMLTRLAAHSTAAKDPAISESSLLSDWQLSVIEPYLADLATFEDNYVPPKQGRSTWEEEETYLEALRFVEEKSIKRVEASPIFRGFIDEDYRRFGREAAQDTSPTSAVAEGDGSMPSVRLRDRFNDFLWAALNRQWKLGLVSVNWSGQFIEGVLGGMAVQDAEAIIPNNHSRRSLNKPEPNDLNPEEKSQLPVLPGQNRPTKTNTVSKSDQRLNKTEIELTLLANKITPEPRITGPPAWNKPLTTAGDKARAFNQLRNSLKHSGKVVYIGDSKTDLLCLRDADFGIIIADDPGQSLLLATLQRLGSEVPHVGQIILPLTKYAWARDFTEILDSKILSKLAEKS